MSEQRIFRVSFHNKGQVYEVYAERISNAELFGFVAIESLRFSESEKIVIDPEEERLKNEFRGVQRTLLPMHAIIRIDEVDQAGVATAVEFDTDDSNVTPFPLPFPPPK